VPTSIVTFPAVPADAFPETIARAPVEDVPVPVERVLAPDAPEPLLVVVTINEVPALVGLIVLPIVTSAPVTVRVLEVDPPAIVNPSEAEVKVKLLYVDPVNTFEADDKVSAFEYVPDNPAD